MAQCSDIRLILGAFEDGELEPHEMQEVARHLAQCQDCETVLAGYNTLGRLLRDSTPQPVLDGFSRRVEERIEELRPPMTGRLREYLGAFGERFGSGFGLAVASASIAVLTVFIVTPLARQAIAPDKPVTVASATHSTAPNTLALSGQNFTPARLASSAEPPTRPSTIISRLETDNPAVAVWSEPRGNTTVIWLPDQP